MEQYKKWLEEQIEKCLNDKDLQREHWAYCTAYRKLIEALPIHGVVRGGDFENKSVSRDQVISKKETSELILNTPTEQLATEALDTLAEAGEETRKDFCIWYYAQSQPLDANKVYAWFLARKSSEGQA